jgi:hypothetical protein
VPFRFDQQQALIKINDNGKEYRASKLVVVVGCTLERTGAA